MPLFPLVGRHRRASACVDIHSWSARAIRPPRSHLDADLNVLICPITGFHKACSVSVRGRAGRGLWPRTWSSRYRNAVGTTHGRRAGGLPRRMRDARPDTTSWFRGARAGRGRPRIAVRGRREKSGRAGQGYPAARRDGRRPVSLVTRRGGVQACGGVGELRGRSRAMNGATTRSVRPTPEQAPSARDDWVVVPGRVLSDPSQLERLGGP